MPLSQLATESKNMNDTNEPATRWQRIAATLIIADFGFPTESVIEAREYWDELRANFLEELSAAVINPARVIDEENALFLYAIFLAAEKRDAEFGPLLLALLRLPYEQVDGLLGDGLLDSTGRCLASLHRGDDTPLRALAADVELNSYVRFAAIDALMVRVMEGDADADADALADFLFGLAQGLAILLRDDGRWQAEEITTEDDELFQSLVGSLAGLGATRYLPAIEQWNRDDLIDPYYDDVDHLRKTILASLEDRRADMHKPHYVRDVIAEMSWWACFTVRHDTLRHAGGQKYDDAAGYYDDDAPFTVPYVREQPKIGRNDPCPCQSGKKFKKCCGADA